MVTPATTKWGAGPASLPPGAQAAALEGDPSKPGPFTLRIKIPDGHGCHRTGTPRMST